MTVVLHNIQDINNMYKGMKKCGVKFYLPIPGYPVDGMPLLTVNCLFDPKISDMEFVKIVQDICEIIDRDIFIKYSACLLQEAYIQISCHHNRYLLLKTLLHQQKLI